MKNKRICIIYTGGTIGMLSTENGYKPKPKWLSNTIKNMHLFHNEHVPTFEIIEYENLIDSSDIKTSHWIKISESINHRYNEFDGFIILHGTDTMAYTASALSFILKNLNKPVICTGSQIPLSELRTDAVDNILDSLIIASNCEIPEVCIYFNKKLLRGNRTTKINSSSMSAFLSPNYPSLGTVGIDVIIKKDLIRTPTTKRLEVTSILNPKIAIITIFPDFNSDLLEYILKSDIQGLIIKTYGSGNIPNNKNLLNSIKEATKSGIIIINCSQCPIGNVNMSTYENGQILQKTGIISGFDMTDEAALTKLYYLFSIGMSNEDILKNMQVNLRGELTN